MSVEKTRAWPYFKFSHTVLKVPDSAEIFFIAFDLLHSNTIGNLTSKHYISLHIKYSRHLNVILCFDYTKWFDVIFAIEKISPSDCTVRANDMFTTRDLCVTYVRVVYNARAIHTQNTRKTCGWDATAHRPKQQDKFTTTANKNMHKNG